MAKRERIKRVVCVATTGDTKTMSVEQQNEIERSHRLCEIRKIEEKLANSPIVHTTTVVYNPNRHKFAIVFGEKVRIHNEREWRLFVEQQFTVVDK